MGAIYRECVGCNIRYASIDEDLCENCAVDYRGLKTAEITEPHIPCHAVNPDGTPCQNRAAHWVPFGGNVCPDHLGDFKPEGEPRLPSPRTRLRDIQLDEAGNAITAAKGKGRVPMPPPGQVMEDSRTQRTRTRGDAERAALHEGVCMTCGGTGRSRDGRDVCSAGCDEGWEN